MNRLLRHEPADLVATAEAGLTLSSFQKQLGLAGQWLPIDPPDDGRATLGGVIATGLGGPHSFGFGWPRSFVIGMRVLLADGRSIKAGGNVVKNVAGYDLCKLFTGSYGTLGLITELTFKLRPLPAESRTVVASGSLASLITAGRKAFGQLSPIAIELISPRLAHDLQITKKPDAALMMRFVGSARSVITQTAQALKLLRADGNPGETLTEDQQSWSRLSALPLGSADELRWRVALRPTDLAGFLSHLAELEDDEASHPGLCWHAGLGDGRLRAFARTPVYHREAVRALERLRQQAENLGGSLIVESAREEIKNEFDAWGDFGSAAQLMQRVKAQLDPDNRLSPGRFV
jgi:FAD/FMN-containing dehydrogenase